MLKGSSKILILFLDGQTEVEFILQALIRNSLLVLNPLEHFLWVFVGIYLWGHPAFGDFVDQELSQLGPGLLGHRALFCLASFSGSSQLFTVTSPNFLCPPHL